MPTPHPGQSAAQMREDGEHPTVIIGSGKKLQLREDACDVCLDGFRGQDQPVAYRLVDRPSAMRAREALVIVDDQDGVHAEIVARAGRRPYRANPARARRTRSEYGQDTNAITTRRRAAPFRRIRPRPMRRGKAAAKSGDSAAARDRSTVPEGRSS